MTRNNKSEEIAMWDEDDTTGHGSTMQHNETVVTDHDDTSGHGSSMQHNETVVADDVSPEQPAER